MVFASGFAAIRGVWAGIFASFWCFGEGGVDQGAFPIDLVGAVKFGQEEGVEFEPHSRFVPDLQMMPTGLAATATQFGRQIIPSDAGLEDEKDAGENHAIVERFAAWKAKSPGRMRRQQRLNAFPKRVRDKRFHGGPPEILAGGDRMPQLAILTMIYQLKPCQMIHFFRTVLRSSRISADLLTSPLAVLLAMKKPPNGWGNCWVL
jgi:hypothetical protein